MRLHLVRRTLQLVALVATAPALAEPVRYVLDPNLSFVHFEVRHFGTSTIRGRFGPIAGEVMLDRAAARGRVGLAIRTDSVDLGIGVFDARLREPDLLNVRAFPDAFFVADNFRFERDALVEVRGEFTLGVTSQPLSLRAIRFACRGAPVAGEEVCGGDFESEVLRSEFGMSFGLPFIADRVRLRVQVEGTRR